MDVTTISLGSATRDELAEYRDAHGLPNYDAALQRLLTQVDPSIEATNQGDHSNTG